MKKLFRNAIQVILHPVNFYRDMPKKGGYADPLLFLAVMFVLVYILEFAAGAFRLGSLELAWVNLQVQNNLLLWLSAALLPLAGSFVFSGMLYLIWKLMRSKESYETAHRCAAYGTAILPVVTLFVLIPVIYGLILFSWSHFLLFTMSEQVHKLPKFAPMAGFLFVSFAIVTARAFLLGFP